MVESVTYQGRRVALQIPEYKAFEAEAIGRGLGQLQQSINRMTAFAAEQNQIKAKIEGDEYGAANAPTMEQILAARETGEELTLPGDKNTLFGRAARQAAATIVSSELELAARKEMNSAILDFETREANPASLQDKLDAIILGYSSTFDETVPSMARSMKAKLALTANAKYASYHSSFITKQQVNSKSNWLSSKMLQFDSFDDLFRIGIETGEGDERTPVTPQIIAALKANDLNEMENRNFSAADIQNYSNTYDDLVKSSSKAVLSDIVLTSRNPRDVINRISTGNLKNLDPSVAAQVNILRDANLSLNDIAKTLRDARTNNLNYQEQEETNANATTVENEDSYIGLTNQAIADGEVGKADRFIDELNKTNPVKAQELREKKLKAGNIRSVSEPGAIRFLNNREFNLTFEDVGSVIDELSLKDRKTYNDLAAKYQDEETAEAKKHMLSLFRLPENYDLLTETDANFEKVLLYRQLTGKLASEVFKAKRAGEDIDAFAVADQLVEMFGSKFEEAFKKVDLKGANQVIELLNDLGGFSIETGAYSQALNEINRLIKGVQNEGTSFLPPEMQGGTSKSSTLTRLKVQRDALLKVIE